jgi:hypothetical protein
MADLEAIHTFEGIETMQTLIVGRDITGISAFTYTSDAPAAWKASRAWPGVS